MKARRRHVIRNIEGLNLEKKHILDIGCGTGQTIGPLVRALNCHIDGADLDDKLLKNAQPIQGSYFVLDVFDDVPELHEQYDAILLLDVVEHLKDDVSFVENCAKFVKPGGHIIINVPAYQMLFSNYDLHVGHFRRYTKSTMKVLGNSSNLEVLRQQYWGFLLIPLLILRKMILVFTPKERVIKQGFREPSKIVGKILDLICIFEYYSALSQVTPGTSLLSVMKKKG